MTINSAKVSALKLRLGHPIQSNIKKKRTRGETRNVDYLFSNVSLETINVPKAMTSLSDHEPIAATLKSIYITSSFKRTPNGQQFSIKWGKSWNNQSITNQDLWKSLLKEARLINKDKNPVALE